MERGVLNLINYGNKEKFVHIIICLTEAGPLVQEIVPENCHVIQLHKPLGNDLKLPFKIRSVIRAYDVNLLHARGWPTLVETAIAGSFSKVKGLVFGFHGRTHEELNNGSSILRSLAQRIFIRAYDEVVTLNEKMRKEFSKEFWVSDQSVEIIYNGVDGKRFSSLGNASELRSKYLISPDRFIVGTIGRLDPVKNHEVLLKAFHLLKKQGSHFVLLIVGEGGHFNVLKNECKRLGIDSQVTFLGRTDRVPEILNCMDLYIQSSWYEGFSNTILEAMSCGVPVLASNVGGNSSVVPDLDGKNLFSPEDEKELAEKILEMAKDSTWRTQVGLLGKQRVSAQFSVKRMVKHYEEIYSRLAGELGIKQ